MKKRGLAICLAVLLCLTGIGVRIWYVNKDREETVTEIYPMGEMVSFGEDYFHRDDEIRRDYSVRVNSAEIMPAEEYAKTLGYTPEEVWPDGTVVTDIFAVEVTIRNDCKEEDPQFFDLLNVHILSEGEDYQYESDLMEKMYPVVGQTAGFKVAPGTEYTMTIPYAVLDWQHTDSEKIKQKQNYLLLSMYPTKKMIEVIPE